MKIKLKNKFRQLISIIKKVKLNNSINKLESCDFLLFCHDSNRGVSLNGKAYSPILDSLRDTIESKGYKCITTAHPWSILTGELAYGNPIAINRSYFISKCLDKIFLPLHVNFTLNLYKKILRKTKPRVLVTLNCNDYICYAARELGIFHVELLHGIGYTSIKWDWDIKDPIYIPQGILSLDKVSTETFKGLEKKGITVKEIPHPFLTRFQPNNYETLPTEWKISNKSSNFNKEILFSIQWGHAPGIDELEIFEGTLSNGLFPEKLINIINLTSQSVYWRFRLHPVQFRNPKKYRKLIKFLDNFVKSHDNCEWEESTYLPLPSILRNCSGHITMSSMSSYEAAYMGIQTMALAPYLNSASNYQSQFSDLIENGYLYKGDFEEAEILDWITDVQKIEPLLISYDTNINIIEWLLSQSNVGNRFEII